MYVSADTTAVKYIPYILTFLTLPKSIIHNEVYAIKADTITKDSRYSCARQIVILMPNIKKELKTSKAIYSTYCLII